MSSSPSLALLKGGQKSMIEDALETKAGPGKLAVVDTKPAEEASPEVIDIDLDTMSEEEIEALIKEHGIQEPPGWEAYTLDQKRSWLTSTFSVEEEEPTLPAEEPIAETIDGAETGATVAPNTEASKAVAKAPKKTSKSTKKAAPPAEIVEADVIIDVVSEIEHLTREGALNLVHQLTEETEITYFRLGGALSVVMRNEWFKPDYPTFRDYVEQVYGMAYRRAAYWVAIYNALSESGIPWAKVKDVGWTKLKEIAQVLTQENVDEWVQRALSMNTQNLIAAVKAAQNDGTPKALEDANAKATVSKTFKLHTDQVAALDAAIDKAKKQSDTTVDTVALQYICEDFVGSMGIEERLKKLGIEKLLKLIENVFPDVDLQLTVK